MSASTAVAAERRWPATTHPLAAKVPQITALFWVVKVLTTGMGEAASDFLAKINLVLAGGVGLVGFVLALAWQLRARDYRAGRYWLAVAMVAVFGTMAADGVHKVLGVPYVATTVFYSLAVAAVFWLWHRAEGTLSIHSIVTTRRELFYWATVLATFALGTAAGDLTAFTLHLGYRASALFFGVAILVPAVGYATKRVNPVLAFWAAYVLTRPLGASVADWLGKPRGLSGIGVGDGTVTVLSALLIAVVVGYLTVTGRDAPEPS